jgi:hypothetical protein
VAAIRGGKATEQAFGRRSAAVEIDFNGWKGIWAGIYDLMLFKMKRLRSTDRSRRAVACKER